MSLLSTTTILSEKASGNRTEENRSSKLSIDAAHPFAAASLTKSGSLGCYNGSEATHREKDVPLTVQNKMSSASAETLYSLRNDWMNSGRQYCDGPSYRSRWIGITRGKQWDLSKRIQFNPTSMMLSCTVLWELWEAGARRRQLELEQVAEIEYMVASWQCFENFEKQAAHRGQLVAEIEYVVAGSGAMSGTKLTPIGILNTQFGYLMPNLVAHHQSRSFPPSFQHRQLVRFWEEKVWYYIKNLHRTLGNDRWALMQIWTDFEKKERKRLGANLRNFLKQITG